MKIEDKLRVMLDAWHSGVSFWRSIQQLLISSRWKTFLRRKIMQLGWRVTCDAWHMTCNACLLGCLLKISERLFFIYSRWKSSPVKTNYSIRVTCDASCVTFNACFLEYLFEKVNSSFSFLPDEKLSCEDKLRQAPKLINVDKPRCRVSTSFPFDDLKSRWEISGNGNINKSV